MQPHIKLFLFFFNLFICVCLFLWNSLSFANPVIVITGNQVIDHPTSYKDVTLDMTNGEFTIKRRGSLTIENSVINVTVSPSNPFGFQLMDGKLTLNNNVLNATSSGITPKSDTQALYYLIKVDRGLVVLLNSNFTIDTNFTVGFLKTNPNFRTSGFAINHNSIINFHGGLYLANSNNAEVSNNLFQNVSFSNIFDTSQSNQYKENRFLFPGNLALGDAFDIINSDDLTITNNIISSGSNYGIFIMGSQNLNIRNNKLTDNLSYGIFIKEPTEESLKKDKYLSQLIGKYKIKSKLNNNITITNNYFSLNRYGLAGTSIQNLTVADNTFIQRFADKTARQFWTNNDNLLVSVTNIIWHNNLYKEGFTQENGGDNTLALKFVEFPEHGGVSL